MASFLNDRSTTLSSSGVGARGCWIASKSRPATNFRYQLHSSAWKATALSPTKRIQREIPGSYGLPLLGSISDRFNYFYFQGAEEFFRSRAEKYQSTVFRVNMPPGPPFFPDPRVIVLLDQQSFPALFDVSKVSKRDVFTGTYKPSADFNGGYRILSYLDADEPRHAQIKAFCFDMLKSRAKSIVPGMDFAACRCFDRWEKELRAKQAPELISSIEEICLAFLTRALMDHDATGASGLSTETIKKWLAPQIAPVALLDAIPPPIMELLHVVPLPFAVVKKDYEAIVSYFSAHSTALLDLAATHGVPRDEALHNLIFMVCFNTFGGLIRLLPEVVQRVHESGVAKELSNEVAAAVRDAGGRLTARSIDGMPLLHSVVYECLRFQPPVPFQYARARQDMVIESHKEAFRVKKGEMLCGFQPFATRDGVVFDRPNEFLPRRFMGDDGAKLLKYVLWSNGPQTENPSVDNKQCAGKDFIILVTRLFLAEFFLRYESFQLDGQSIKSLSRRSPST
ncbi:allene oxide synthase-like [Selaginella moellendorffii]|uniref:allene oxide synthase-like n=1 Tax=Selaginella moellendorffii TaxID=88036 RepID=UPI000D1C3B2F|nr:allene oxide synthase-like [Selaginella moellendorffii]|eukprot:XP_024517561.1 allene oxide synthase-like [Selaginella moellendorffii]